MWRVSRILGERSPFDPSILKHNQAQLDFILEMYAKDHPKELRFERAGRPNEDMMEVIVNKGWADVLKGSALAQFMRKRLPSDNVMAMIRRMGSRKR